MRKCFVIAEAGVNHSGILKDALEMVDTAFWAGADAVKFQTFKAEQVATNQARLADYQKISMRQQVNQREMLRKLELRPEYYKPLIDRCRKKNILFISTPHGGKESVDFLESVNISMYKIGSGDLVNYILLDKIARLGKPIILSTGMATMMEVKDAIHFLKKKGAKQISALHCTSEYPCPLGDVNLSSMVSMMKELRIPVGYSDHTVNTQVAIMAVTLGASIYECHFTLDKKRIGPDHQASLGPNQLKKRIKAIRDIETIWGKGEKSPTEYEKKHMISLVRKSVVAARNLSKNHQLVQDDLEAKRPGNGVSAIHFEKFIGKKISRNILADEQIALKDIK